MGTLTAANPAGQPYGYNLSYRAVLPEGISYVPGSGHASTWDAGTRDDRQRASDRPDDADLVQRRRPLPASSNALTFQVAHSTTHFTIGGGYTVQAGAYISEAARYVPKFSAAGTPEGPSSTSFTGFATGSAVSTITALQIAQSEESPEGEILRADSSVHGSIVNRAAISGANFSTVHAHATTTVRGGAHPRREAVSWADRRRARGERARGGVRGECARGCLRVLAVALVAHVLYRTFARSAPRARASRRGLVPAVSRWAPRRCCSCSPAEAGPKGRDGSACCSTSGPTGPRCGWTRTTLC